MRIARVIGSVTLNRCIEQTRPGRYLIAVAFDRHCLPSLSLQRQSPMPESLVVFDQLGAGMGQIIAVSEGREAAMPFHPDRVCIDANSAAILDRIQYQDESCDGRNPRPDSRPSVT